MFPTDSRTYWHAVARSLAVACAVLLLPVAHASAQSNSLFGSSGPLSQGVGGASRGAAASPLGAGGLGAAGGMGAGGLGAAAGQNGLNGPQFSGLSNLGQLSATVGQNGFIGGTAANGGRFVGARTAGQQQGAQGQQGLNRNQAGQQNRGANQAGRNGAGNQNGFNMSDFTNGPGGAAGQKKTTTAAPPQQKIAFQYSSLRADEITRKIQLRLEKQSISVPGGAASGQISPVNVNLDESGMATLRGQVSNDDSKRLIEALVRLEPGVRRVSSELQVAN